MYPVVLPVANVMYRSFYDEQEYRLKMQQLAGYGGEPVAFEPVAPSPGWRVATLGSRIKSTVSSAISAVLSL